MTSTIDAPATPEMRAACTVVVRRLPRQAPVAEAPEPDHAVEPAAPDPWGSGRALAYREVRTVLQMMMETLDGRRPRSQLGGRLSKEVLRYLAVAGGRLNPPADRRAAALRGRHGPPALRTVRVSHPAEGVAEASAVWRLRGRFRALAARFEWTGTRWVCTALHLG